MSDKKLYTRRRLLATATVTALAGCTSEREDTNETTTSESEPRTTTARTTTQPAETPSRTIAEGVERIEDVPFRETPHGTLELDLYLPTSGSDHPFFVFAHGGAWIIGDKGERPMFADLATNGYAVADIQYRLALDEDRQYPVPVRDVTAAVKWVKANAGEYDIDASTGALAGYSAGAHLAALVALAPDHETFQPVDFHPEISASVDAIVGYSGPYDFTAPEAEGSDLIANFFGENASEETLAEGSPVTHVDSEDPPALLLHGTNDVVVPYRSTTVLADAFRDVDVPVEVFTADGGGHRMINNPEWREQTHPLQRQFLDEYL
jgi:acetyl esterase/lipase